jgi:hypothetical protein
MLPLLRQVIFGEYGLNRTSWLARSTIDAFGRVYIEHFGALEVRLILARMNAVDRANINARRVFRAYAGLGYYVGHNSS